jgi:hypothetical protein
MAKHLSAVYHDQHQQRHEIKYEELSDPRKLQEARGHKLFDASEEFRMSVRGGQSPHFFALSTGGRLLTDAREEADPAHNERIEHLVNELNAFEANQTIELGTYAWNKETKEQEWAPFAEVCGYRWRGEVTRALSATTRCRHGPG